MSKSTKQRAAEMVPFLPAYAELPATEKHKINSVLDPMFFQVLLIAETLRQEPLTYEQLAKGINRSKSHTKELVAAMRAGGLRIELSDKEVWRSPDSNPQHKLQIDAKFLKPRKTDEILLDEDIADWVEERAVSQDQAISEFVNSILRIYKANLKHKALERLAEKDKKNLEAKTMIH